ncbi:MAG: hypothetical protein K2H46_02065 [Muribaculaceae bacterium]|nr:hypothetical protein [Muribaculaceae bacterium]
MPRKLIIIIPLFIFLLLNALHANGAKTAIARNEPLLSRLDSILSNHFRLVNEKEIRIDGLKETLKRTKTGRDSLALTRQLYDEYLVYDSDSALLFADQSRSIAEKIAPENYNLITEWKLNQAFLLTVQGLYDATLRLLSEIDAQKLNNETKALYFNTYAYLHSMSSVFVDSDKKLKEEELRKANIYRDSIQQIKNLTTDEWLWVPVALNIDNPGAHISEVDVTALQKSVDNNTLPSRKNAINAYWLSRYYESMGDEVQMVKYKTMAAIYDARIVNREIAALQELAQYLFDNEDLNRAYTYLIYAVNQANLYHNRYRIVSLSDALPSVRDKYKNDLEKRDRRLSLMVWVLGVLSFFLVGCIVFIIFEFNKLKKIRNLLKKANGELSVSVKQRDKAICQLEQSNSELHTLNKELQETNTQKLSLLAYAFKLTAHYINTLEDYRKKLLKKYKAKRFDELGILINDPELIKEHYQGFYADFDKMVLSLFPKFIEEYNESASAENQVSPEMVNKTKILNTRLRIHALRKLGVSKSSDIAGMLNVSIRTVYNNKTGSTGLNQEENSN